MSDDTVGARIDPTAGDTVGERTRPESGDTVGDVIWPDGQLPKHDELADDDDTLDWPTGESMADYTAPIPDTEAV